ncbi:MAG: T9SS type A sorting domain-containing protein [Candidatus Latescibacterota bacterium]|nr:MAG: T9SS type A sorting domain-containing protein [Candidatus Latescibacterota bacterium]
MKRLSTTVLVVLAVAIVVTMLASIVHARPSIRRDFFDIYTNAVGTQLDDLPSSSRHCGVCHFDFSGGGPRNPYGFDIQVGINGGLSATDAILAIEGDDSDNDGYTNYVENVDTISFSNTPTFAGLSASNVGDTSSIPLGEVTPYLTPSGSTDTTPPVVTVLYPNGGETITPNANDIVSFTATDLESGVSHVDVYLSDDGGSTFKPIAAQADPTSDVTWFVPNLPGGTNLVRVEAYDNAGNDGSDDSDSQFTIDTFTGGRVPTTLRDMELPGTQPFEGAVMEDPNDCRQCHGDYNAAVEPWHNWSGSMMGQAMRDPLFLACVTVAEQDAPGVGDLCLRCHTPGGWQEGRSVDTSGGLMNDKDREGIHCDFCHRVVDRNYVEGVSPAQDVDVLNNIVPLPLQYANGQFINDPAPLRRGPYADADAAHAFVESPIHRSSDMCGTCHDVSSPVFEKVAPGDYAPTAFDEKHPDMDLRNMFPIERTYSEWTQSEYATTGVFQPQFAGNKPDGIVSSCQDCHMRDVQGKGSNVGGSPNRADLPLHDMMGGNTFIPDVLPAMYPGEVDATALQDAKARAISMLQLAATLEATPEEFGLTVRVWNETGHKLPSGYPEGRRIWLHVVAYDAEMTQVFESAAYDFDTAVLSHDSQAKIYEIKPGLSPALASLLGLTEGPSFHFVLNDTIFSDNRIPPRGFTNAAFEAIQSPPVAHSYADGQYWDDTPYFLPIEADTAVVTLYYQTLSKEYVEFLRDENVTDTKGQELYDAWAAHGKSTPVVMAQVGVGLNVIPSDVTETATRIPASLSEAWPNPFTESTRLSYYVPMRGHVSVEVYDVRGRRVRTLVVGPKDSGRHEIGWNGRDDAGRNLSAGVYFVRYRTDQRVITRRMLRLQ